MEKKFYSIVKRIVLAIIGIIVVIAVETNVQRLVNPIRMSEARIRDNILALTPMGMYRDDVWEFIRERDDWHLMTGSWEMGARSRVSLPDWPWVPGVGVVVGESHIIGDVGGYRALRWLFILEIRVIAFWAFDADGNLIEVFVERDFAL